MGFFDKRSRIYRQKIQDLQAELEQARKEGNYVVEQGIYFADSPTMGDETRVVMVDRLHSSEEVDVLRAFFDRNGFTVEKLELDSSARSVEQCEIIPPNELLVGMVKLLQSQNYRVIDDSDQKQPFSALRQVFPVTALAHAISVLFVSRVQKILATTSVKMTKEGNRLLSWMALLHKTLRTQVDPAVINCIDIFFDEAFDHFYNRDARKEGEKSPLQLQLDKLDEDDLMGEYTMSQLFVPIPIEKEEEEEPEARHKGLLERVDNEEQQVYSFEGVDAAPSRSGADSGSQSDAISSMQLTGSVAPAAIEDKEIDQLKRSDQLAKTMALMYRTLVRSSDDKARQNAQTLLQQIQPLFKTSASCLLVKSQSKPTMSLFAQCGRKLVWGKGEGRPMSVGLIRDCVKCKTNVAGTSHDEPGGSLADAHVPAYAVATPVSLKEHICAILYLERAKEDGPFDEEEMRMMRRVVRVFQDFPDLTLGWK